MDVIVQWSPASLTSHASNYNIKEKQQKGNLSLAFLVAIMWLLLKKTFFPCEIIGKLFLFLEIFGDAVSSISLLANLLAKFERANYMQLDWYYCNTIISTWLNHAKIISTASTAFTPQLLNLQMIFQICWPENVKNKEQEITIHLSCHRSCNSKISFCVPK